MKRELILILIIFSIAGLLSLAASVYPDGLEKVAENLGFTNLATAPLFSAPIPDYIMPGINNELWATSLAGLSGTVLVLVVGLGVSKFLTKRANR